MTSTKSKYSCVELSDGVVVKNNETGDVLSNINPTGLMTQGVLQIKTSVISGVTEATGAETHRLPTLSKIQETLAALPTSVVSALDTIGLGDTRHVPTTNYVSSMIATPSSTTDVTLGANHTLTPATGAVAIAGGCSVAKNMIIGNGVNKNIQFFTTNSTDADDPHFASVCQLIDVPEAGGSVNPRILMAGGTGEILGNTHSMMDMTYFYDQALMYYDIFPTAAFVGTPQFNFYRPVFGQGQLGLIKSHADGTHVSHLENVTYAYAGSVYTGAYSGMKVIPDEAAKLGLLAISTTSSGKTAYLMTDATGNFHIDASSGTTKVQTRNKLELNNTTAASFTFDGISYMAPAGATVSMGGTFNQENCVARDQVISFGRSDLFFTGDTTRYPGLVSYTGVQVRPFVDPGGGGHDNTWVIKAASEPLEGTIRYLPNSITGAPSTAEVCFYDSDTLAYSWKPICPARGYTKEVQLLAGVRSTGAGGATQTAVGNFQFWTFAGNADNDLFMQIDMPHDWKQESDLNIHIHWFSEDNTAGNIDWSLTYNVGAYNGAFDTTGTTATTRSIANSATTYKHQMTDVATIGMSGVTADGACINLRLRRLGSTDTYNKLAYLVSAGCHYTSNRFGS